MKIVHVGSYEINEFRATAYSQGGSEIRRLRLRTMYPRKWTCFLACSAFAAQIGGEFPDPVLRP
jgi:hypothetical protein